MGIVRQSGLFLIFLIGIEQVTFVLSTDFPPAVIRGGSGGGGRKEKKGFFQVPCPTHSVCWLLCGIFYDEKNFGSGCCWERKYEGDKGQLISLPGIDKTCWCCFAPTAFILVPGAVDGFCEQIIPPVQDLTQNVTILDNVCLAGVKLKVKCEPLYISNVLSLLDISGKCDGMDVVGSLLEPVAPLLPGGLL